MAAVSLSNLKKTWFYLRKNGVKAAYLAAVERLCESGKNSYTYEPVPERARQKQRSFPVSDIRFSVVVPTFDKTKREHLTALLDSLEAQTYPYWELVLADASESGNVRAALEQWIEAHAFFGRQDREIRYVKLSCNAGIAENTNAGIARATGGYIGLLDHDDLLTPDALYEVARAVEEGKKAGERPQVLYSDEDKCDGTAAVFYEPHFKMDFNLDLLLSNNYICHFLVMESGLLKSLRLRSGFDGAQDYDLVLRAAGQKARFAHIPRVLYHWRCHGGSTAVNPQSKAYAYEAGKRAVEDFCRQAGWKAKVSHLKHLGFYRVDYEGDIFIQRPEVGALATALPDRKKLRSGIYDEKGNMLFEGLRKGFSGPMHRAALQQEVFCADLRGMRVRKELLPRYEEAVMRLKNLSEAEIRRACVDFCEGLKKEGYRIVWDPQV